MAFRSGGRQGVSRMKSQPRQISRVRSSSTISKYGGRVSTRPAPKSLEVRQDVIASLVTIDQMEVHPDIYQINQETSKEWK